MKFMNMSPCGPFLQEMWGNLGLPKFGAFWGGVSGTRSESLQFSLHRFRRFKYVAIPWVVVRPLLNGVAAVPIVPNAV